MAGVGVIEIIWLTLTVVLGLGVVIAWIVIAEANRKYFKAEIKKLKTQLEAVEQEKAKMIEEIQAFSSDSGFTPGGQGQSGELEAENEKLKKELAEAKSSLEEVYKALCSK